MLVRAILAAVIPTLIYSLIIWWLDRYEKEPLPLILAAFFWGAVPAIALALLVEFVFAMPVEQSPLGPGSASWGLAPVVEEVLKALALGGLFLWAQDEFDGMLDGIVYGALIGFGFSMTENALYFIRYEDVGGLFWMRSVFFGLNHAFFTSLVGLAFGAVRFRKSPLMLWMAVLAGLTLATMFHAAHNYLTTVFESTGLVYSWLVQASGVLVVLAIAVLAWRHELSWLRDELGDEVGTGVISAQDYAAVSSSTGRLRRESSALFTGGIVRFWRVRRLHYLITELAFCKSKQRLADPLQDCAQIDQLRRAVVDLRESLKEGTGVWV